MKGLIAFVEFQRYICTHKLCNMKNVTLSIPENLLRKSREYAKNQGTSLNELIRSLLRNHVDPEENDPVQRLIEHTNRLSINTKNLKWTRDDIYDRKVFS